MTDEEYMAFCCNDPEHPCDFRLQARTKEEAAEYARAHMEREHGMKGPEAAERVERSIKPAREQDWK